MTTSGNYEGGVVVSAQSQSTSPNHYEAPKTTKSHFGATSYVCAQEKDPPNNYEAPGTMKLDPGAIYLPSGKRTPLTIMKYTMKSLS